MAGRTWEPTKKGIRDLNRWLSKGKTVYTVSAMATNLGRYEDSHTYSAYTFDRQSRITGEWMTGHLSVSGLMGQYGAVYEKPHAACATSPPLDGRSPVRSRAATAASSTRPNSAAWRSRSATAATRRSGAGAAE